MLVSCNHDIALSKDNNVFLYHRIMAYASISVDLGTLGTEVGNIEASLLLQRKF
jgi:hypothetical protein